MKLLQIVFLVLCLGSVGINFAQDLSGKSNINTKGDGLSYFLTQLNYVNDAVFMGRTDSIAAPYVLPSVGYYDQSGFFADFSTSYLTGSEENRIDLFLVSAGFSWEPKKLGGGISGTAYFFNQDSYNVKSEVIADITGALSYDFQLLEARLMLSTYLNDGSSADFFAGLSIDRTIEIVDDSYLIIPQISIFGGSQYFYQEYYRTSRLGNRKGQGMGTGTSQVGAVDIVEAEKFKLLNVEFSMPMYYFHKNFIFSFQPVLALPQNSAELVVDEIIFKEDLSSVFYWSVGISYWFKM